MVRVGNVIKLSIDIVRLAINKRFYKSASSRPEQRVVERSLDYIKRSLHYGRDDDTSRPFISLKTNRIYIDFYLSVSVPSTENNQPEQGEIE